MRGVGGGGGGSGVASCKSSKDYSRQFTCKVKGHMAGSARGTHACALPGAWTEARAPTATLIPLTPLVRRTVRLSDTHMCTDTRTHVHSRTHCTRLAINR